MIKTRLSADRGKASHGWLESRHTFSFARYYDPAHMGVSALRVINDDKVTPGAGFGMHSHQDMEIISYVKKGTIEHKDSMGHTEQLPAGEFQLMSAGYGITHSEYNASQTEPLEFLQIWIEPNVYGIEPEYQQKHFENSEGLQLIASPDARNGSLLLHQDALLFRLQQAENQQLSYVTDHQRTIYIHIISGVLEIDSCILREGDGATISSVNTVDIFCHENCEALLFDLP